MRKGASRAAARQRGVSLLEVLVAFSIMAFSLAAIYGALSSSIRSVRTVDRLDRAVRIAEQLMARFDSAPKGGWQETGRQDDGYAWSVAMTPLASEVDPPVAMLYHVAIRVEWVDFGRAKEFSLDSVVTEKVGGAL